jgi:aminoglycoside phosphotransferase
MVHDMEAQLRASYSAYEWIPITHGMSGAPTYQLRGREQLYPKLGDSMLAEAQRIDWLHIAGIPGPRLCDAGETDGVQWLVMTAVPGRVMVDPWPADQRLRVIDAAAEILRALQTLPASNCPTAHTYWQN